jgi:acyl carrier protein
VVVAQADIADACQVMRRLEEIEQLLPPLRGVIHAAGTLDDALLLQQNWDSFSRVMAPKVTGAWHLHTLTRQCSLDFFLLFSSAASLLGSPGQANHAAANAFLDALGHHRRAEGLPGLSINWSAWAEVGAAAERKVAERIKTKGIGAIAPLQGLQALERLLSQSSSQVGVIPIDWPAFMAEAASIPFFSDFKPAAAASVLKQPEFLQEYAAAAPHRRPGILLAHVRSQVAKVLGLSPSKAIDLQHGFFELGMDSLTAVELRNRLQASFGCTLPSTLAFDYPTIDGLLEHLLQKLSSLGFASESRAEANEEKLADLANLDRFSEDEIGALIDVELGSIEERGV